IPYERDARIIEGRYHELLTQQQTHPTGRPTFAVSPAERASVGVNEFYYIDYPAFGMLGASYLVAASLDNWHPSYPASGKVHLWLMGDAHAPVVLDSPINSLSLALGHLPGGNLLLAVGEKAGMVHLREIAETDDGPTVEPAGAPLPAHNSKVKNLAFGQLPGGNLLLAVAEVTEIPVGPPRPAGFGTFDNDYVNHITVRLWEITETPDGPTAQPLEAPLAVQSTMVRAMAFGQLPGGNLILAFGGDDKLHLWKITETGGRPTAQPAGDLTLNPSGVRAMAFGQLPDGNLILAYATEETVHLWEITQTGAGPHGRQMAVLPHGHFYHPLGLKFHEFNGSLWLLVIDSTGAIQHLIVQEVFESYADRPDSLMASLMWLLDREAYPGLFAGWTSADLRAAMRLSPNEHFDDHIDLFTELFGVRIQPQRNWSGFAQSDEVIGVDGPPLWLHEHESPGRYSPVRNPFKVVSVVRAPAMALRVLDDLWQRAVDGAVAGSRARHDELMRRLAELPDVFARGPMMPELRRPYESAMS
ncbi:WD40 repeat domain-containing protein, partial [Micromonospora sp. NPDC003241]